MRFSAQQGLLRHQVSLVVLSCVAAILLSGCAVMQALESDPGVDLAPVKVGATRQQVESVLGNPGREWVTRTGVRYCLYQYDAGLEPSPPAVAGAVLAEIATLGLVEVIMLGEPKGVAFRGARKYRLIAVSFDSQGSVLGVFHDVGEFTALPEDGRPTAAAEAGANSSVR